MDDLCPNYNTCRLVQTDVVVTDKSRKDAYIDSFCQEEQTWTKCKRYITRKALWVCPDYILPDSDMTEEEIIKRYEKEKENK